LREDRETLVLKIDFAEREALIKKYPTGFFVTNHYRLYPYVLVNLLAVDREILKPLVERAWRMTLRATLAWSSGQIYLSRPLAFFSSSFGSGMAPLSL
jgi:hypothetical protein